MINIVTLIIIILLGIIIFLLGSLIGYGFSLKDHSIEISTTEHIRKHWDEMIEYREGLLLCLDYQIAKLKGILKTTGNIEWYDKELVEYHSLKNYYDGLFLAADNLKDKLLESGLLIKN